MYIADLNEFWLPDVQLMRPASYVCTCNVITYECMHIIMQSHPMANCPCTCNDFILIHFSDQN